MSFKNNTIPNATCLTKVEDLFVTFFENKYRNLVKLCIFVGHLMTFKIFKEQKTFGISFKLK